MTSRYLPARTRRALAKQETCAKCEGPGPFHADHHCPHALGGGNEPENMRRLCVECHKTKTRGDVKMIAKANRLRKGPRPRKGRPMQSRGFQTRVTPHKWPKRKMQSRGWT